MLLKLVNPSTTEVWDTAANAGFDRGQIVARLEELGASGHEVELIDGDAISDEERSDLYGQAFSAVMQAGNRYRIRQVFGSRRHGGGDHLGKGVPALIVFDEGTAVAVFPHEADGNYETIRAYLDSLE